MTGLEKILEEIKVESKATTDEILAQANAEAQQIISASEQEAKVLSEDILKKANAKAEDIILRGDSSANLEMQKAMLAAKQQVINEMLQNTLDYIKNLSEEKYFALILKLIEKNSQETPGEIAFSQADMQRLPENFIDKINTCSKAELTLCQNPANIKSGFVLIYGGIEENCSFEAMFRSKHEDLTDKISAMLFSN